MMRDGGGDKSGGVLQLYLGDDEGEWDPSPKCRREGACH